MLKHTGQIINTGKKCVILMLELPEKPGYSLIAETESLPERIHDPLMAILMSSEAQNSNIFAEVLHRRIMPDNNKTILMELHELGYIRSEPAENIYIVPRNNIRVKASDVIKELKKLSSVSENLMNNDVSEQVNFPSMENMNVDKVEKNEDIAKNMLVQASLLEEDAKKLREKAYSLAPHLIPNKNIKKKEQKDQKQQKHDKKEVEDFTDQQ